jgi:uncharacterized protein
MQFSQEHNNSAYVIKSCSERVIRIISPVTPEILLAAEHEPDKINELRHRNIHKSAIITIERMIENWPPSCVDELSNQHIEMILELDPEVVLIGAGGKVTWPHPQIMQPLIQRHIGYEIMTTPAACRTYNILMHEGRRVAAALMV